jgi:hypothetical protein
MLSAEFLTWKFGRKKFPLDKTGEKELKTWSFSQKNDGGKTGSLLFTGTFVEDSVCNNRPVKFKG